MFDLYKKTQIGDVTTYVKPSQTLSIGQLNGLNCVTISEEKVIIFPDMSTISVPLGTADLSFIITDPSQAFNLVDPTTGVVTGAKTFAELKIEMYSLYLYLASIRDGDGING